MSSLGSCAFRASGLLGTVPGTYAGQGNSLTACRLRVPGAEGPVWDPQVPSGANKPHLSQVEFCKANPVVVVKAAHPALMVREAPSEGGVLKTQPQDSRISH